MRLYFSYYCLPVACFPHSVLPLLSLFSAFCLWLHHAQNCREGPAGGAGSGNVWRSVTLVRVCQVWPEAGDIMFCLHCPAGKTASTRKVLSTDSLFFALFLLFSSFLFHEDLFACTVLPLEKQNWIPTISHSILCQLTFFLPWKRHK